MGVLFLLGLYEAIGFLLLLGDEHHILLDQ